MNRLVLKTSGDGKHLTVHYEPAPGQGIAPGQRELRQALTEQGYGDWRIDSAAVEAFVKRCENATAPVDGQLAECCDGICEIHLAEDRMSARLTLVPPQGGRAVTESEVRDALAMQGVKAGLLDDAIVAAIAAGKADDVLVAQGKEPEAGEAASFTSLLKFDHGPAAAEEGDAKINFRDRGGLLLVAPGTPLMRRTPPVPGKEGLDVMGNPAPARPVADTPFSSNLTGAAPSGSDPDLLVAVTSGRPSVVGNGVSVNPVVNIDSVDLGTGNITFGGTLHVKGDIRAGMTVHVVGDVLVDGTLEAADVEAGGNVVVKGGIVGRIANPSMGQTAKTAHIVCKGSVQARFMEYAEIQAGHNIEVGSTVRESDLQAGDSVIVGKTGGGHIAGGHTRALVSITAGALGSPSGGPVLAQVGFDPHLNAARTEAEQTRKRKMEEHFKLMQVLAFLQQHPERGVGGIQEKTQLAHDRLVQEIDTLTATLQEYTERLQLIDSAHMVFSKHIYSGATLMIGNKRMQLTDDVDGASVKLNGEHIVLD